MEIVNLSTCINSLGLLLDIVGAILIFKFGLPEPISREGYVHLILEQTDEQEKQKALNYDRWSKLGLSSLILGFCLQLVSNFV
jgi:hypothetical protein